MYLEAFPSPFEVTGVSYRIEVDNTTIPFAFPSPLEVTGVSPRPAADPTTPPPASPSPPAVPGACYLKQEKAASTFLTLGFRPLSR